MTNNENHMVIGDPYPNSWEKPEHTIKEIKEEFLEWYLSNRESDLDLFNEFLSFYEEEIYSWFLADTLKEEFYKFKIMYFVKEFKNEKDLNIDEDDAEEIIGELI